MTNLKYNPLLSMTNGCENLLIQTTTLPIKLYTWNIEATN